MNEKLHAYNSESPEGIEEAYRRSIAAADSMVPEDVDAHFESGVRHFLQLCALVVAAEDPEFFESESLDWKNVVRRAARACGISEDMERVEQAVESPRELSLATVDSSDASPLQTITDTVMRRAESDEALSRALARSRLS